MTIKEFIEAHPKARLDLLTPGGYVFLTPERSRALLNGESVAGNNGFGGKENEMEIDARSLLAQTILDVGRPAEGDIWHFLTGYPEESSLPEDADPMKRLQTRLEDCYRAYEAEQQMLNPYEVFENAREIAATREVYEALKDGTLCKPYLDSLLREDNPLTAVRDRWMAYNDVDLSHEMNAVLLQMEQEQEQSQSPTRESPC